MTSAGCDHNVVILFMPLSLVRDFGSWMESEQRRVYALCRHMLQDRDAADSATQDVFLKAYRALKRGDEAQLEDPDRWLMRIAATTCLDRLRSRKWQLWRLRSQPEGDRTQFEAALDCLSVRQRSVFTLRHYQDLSLEEIGGLLGLDVGTVKVHMRHAVSKLRLELRDLYGGTE